MPRRKCPALIPGGRDDLCPEDFDPVQLARGARVELEHTGRSDIAEKIAMGHGREFPIKEYYDELEMMESRLQARQSATPNRSRVRVYDAEELAVNMRETFADRPVEFRYDYQFTWPFQLQHVGESLAVAYGSDKWKPKDSRGKREIELYKHLAESTNHVLVKPGFLCDSDTLDPWPVLGPTVDFSSAPMPKHFAILGLFEEINLRLHAWGDDTSPEFGDDPDDGVVTVKVRHGMLGATKILWSKTGGRDEPILFVYTDQDGILMHITGKKLCIEKDGISG